MDVFRFRNPTNAMRMEDGELINGLKSKMWIERFRDAGDFVFVADAEKRIQNKLPIGSFISHVESDEIMIVENHEITEVRGRETEVKITGRSFESYFDNRIVGSNQNWPTTASATVEYTIPAGYTWDQAVQLLEDHAYAIYIIDPDDAIPYLTIFTDVPGTGEIAERTIRRGSVYSRLIELLNVEDLGVRVVRPGPRSPLGDSDPNMAMVIHAGQDLSDSLVFSYDTGEIESADYLWSNKKLKNYALVTGRWLETVVHDGSSEYDRRMMFVDASDIDSAYSTAPTGATETAILNAMAIRGMEALSAQRDIALLKADTSRSSMMYKYRDHYDVGDLVTAQAEYSESAVMRISEYVEIEDETGESGYPTLTPI